MALSVASQEGDLCPRWQGTNGYRGAGKAPGLGGEKLGWDDGQRIQQIVAYRLWIDGLTARCQSAGEI